MKRSAYHAPQGAKRYTVVEKAESIYSARGRNQQTKNYNPYYGIDPNYGISAELLSAQNRANGLYFENPVAAGIVNSIVDGAIGIGLSPQSYIQQHIITLPKEKISDTQHTIEALWNIWANSPQMCDHHHKQTFGSLQREAYVNASTSGDVLEHIKIVRYGNIYLPQIQNISGTNIKTPLLNDSKKLAGGVEVDQEGREIAFHVVTSGNDMATEVFTRVPKYGSRTKRLMFNLVMLGVVVPGQRRGRSVLTRVGESIIQIGRYSEAELVKAILQSFMTMFIETDKDAVEEESGGNPITNLIDSSVAWNPNDPSSESPAPQAGDYTQPLTLGPGVIWNLPPGKKANLPESKAPVAEFWKFLEAQLKLIGMAVGIPYEVLIKSFNASYSASQASIQDAARGWKIAATEWAYKYCQPVYEQFVEMLVRQGIIDCPGFLENPIIRKAWCTTEWHGPAVLNIDPRKSVEASVTAIQNHMSTHEIEARKLYGHNWEAILNRLAEENGQIEKLFGLEKSKSQLITKDEKPADRDDDDDDKESE
jgi:lambda family phage portal protein